MSIELNSIDSLLKKGNSISINDIEKIVDFFLKERHSFIYNLCNKVYGDVNDVALAAFKESLKNDSKNALITLINKGNVLERNNVVAYLTSSAKNSAIKLYQNQKNIVYVCPACKYFGSEQECYYKEKYLHCSVCEKESFDQTEPEKIAFFKIFSKHTSKGYGCLDCGRFIPKSVSQSGIVSCPYPDCFFSGKVSELNKAKHPVGRKKIKHVSIDNPVANNTGKTSNDNLKSEASGYIDQLKNDNQVSNLEIKEKITNQMKVLLQTIEEQKTAVAFKSNDSTRLLKTTMYNAYLNVINQYPDDMIGYLVHQRRNNGYQYRIFQEFVKLLEEQIPFSFLKNGKNYTITSLLDPALSIFAGENSFVSTIDSQHIIENETKELYIGSRKGSYCKPFYIGKVVDVIDQSNGQSLLDQINHYTFFKICMKNTVSVGTKVSVQHLMIPPHYQMGGMVYLNRIRRAIVDRVYFVLNGKKRTLSR